MADVDLDTVSAALALQIGYDVALLRLAGLIGLESDPKRFDRPYDERTRLEEAPAERASPCARTAPAPSLSPGRPAWQEPRVPVAAERMSAADRSFSRAANVAAWVRPSMPSLACGFET